MHRSSSVSLTPSPRASLLIISLLDFQQSLWNPLMVRSGTASSRHVVPRPPFFCACVQHGGGHLLGQMQRTLDMTTHLGVQTFEHSQARSAVENPGFHSRQDSISPDFQCMERLQRGSGNAACPVFDLSFEVRTVIPHMGPNIFPRYLVTSPGFTRGICFPSTSYGAVSLTVNVFPSDLMWET